MLVAALVIPLLIGVGSYFMLSRADRPAGAGILRQILRGYPYAAVLALSMAFMIVIAPARKLRSMAKRWSDAHIPVVVKPGGYDVVADDLERALDAAGLEIERVRAPRVLEAPSKLLAAVAGPGVDRLIPDELIQLRNRDLEVLIYPSDISIVGKPDQLAHARAAVASRLTFTAAYMTTSEEAQKVEDHLERIWRTVPAVKSAAQALNPANASQEVGMAGPRRRMPWTGPAMGVATLRRMRRARPSQRERLPWPQGRPPLARIPRVTMLRRRLMGGTAAPLRTRPRAVRTPPRSPRSYRLR